MYLNFLFLRNKLVDGHIVFSDSGHGTLIGVLLEGLFVHLKSILQLVIVALLQLHHLLTSQWSEDNPMLALSRSTRRLGKSAVNMHHLGDCQPSPEELLTFYQLLQHCISHFLTDRHLLNHVLPPLGQKLGSEGLNHSQQVLVRPRVKLRFKMPAGTCIT